MVKKTALFGLFLLFYIASAIAQTNEFGIKGGIGNSKLDVTFYSTANNSFRPSYEAIIGYEFGGYYRHAFSKHLGLKGELLLCPERRKNQIARRDNFIRESRLLLLLLQLVITI